MRWVWRYPTPGDGANSSVSAGPLRENGDFKPCTMVQGPSEPLFFLLTTFTRDFGRPILFVACSSKAG